MLRPVLYVRHVFWLDLARSDFAARHGAERATYINLVRHPVRRFVSLFYYELERERFPRTTLDACMGPGGPCALRAWRPEPAGERGGGARRAYDYTPEGSYEFLRAQANNYLTRWFCGHALACQGRATRRTLATALEHVVEGLSLIHI